MSLSVYLMVIGPVWKEERILEQQWIHSTGSSLLFSFIKLPHLVNLFDDDDDEML